MGDNILWTLVCLQPLWRNWPAEQSNLARKRKRRAITPLKVIQSHRGRYQSKARMRLPISDYNSNWHPISCRFGVIAAYCSNFGHFASWATLWELRDNVRCPSWAHWKSAWLPISVNWTFSLVRTAEALRTKIDRKSAISLQCGQFDPKLGDVPHE